MTTEQKLFDLSFLEEMDDKNFIAEVITLYLKDTPGDLKEMKRGFDKGDLTAVSQAAHKTKSSTGMLQANALYFFLEQTETTAKAGEKGSALAKLIDMVQYEFGLLKNALESYLQDMKAAA